MPSANSLRSMLDAVAGFDGYWQTARLDLIVKRYDKDSQVKTYTSLKISLTMTCAHFNNLSAPLLSICFSGRLLTTAGDDRPLFGNLGLRKLKRVQQRA